MKLRNTQGIKKYVITIQDMYCTLADKKKTSDLQLIL